MESQQQLVLGVGNAHGPDSDVRPMSHASSIPALVRADDDAAFLEMLRQNGFQSPTMVESIDQERQDECAKSFDDARARFEHMRKKWQELRDRFGQSDDWVVVFDDDSHRRYPTKAQLLDACAGDTRYKLIFSLSDRGTNDVLMRRVCRGHTCH